MRTISSAALALAMLLLGACATTRQQGFHPPSGNYRLIVMQPDVQVGQVTAGGVVEPREDWTNQARASVTQALQQQQAAHATETKVAASAEDTGWDPVATQDLVSLHRAVGEAIQVHRYGPLKLPTKKDRFDWTLGEQAVAFGAATHYDYALFLRAQDSFSSGGRVALQFMGFLGCLAGVCVIPGGGLQVAFATLVDLKTGQVVWYNVVLAQVGDIRTPEGATEMVGKLLGTMNSAEAQQPQRRTHT